MDDKTENEGSNQPPALNQSTTFPQIHTNLNGMVREFVRTMYQDTKGNYWFGTNGNGIICYDGKTLEKISMKGLRSLNVIRGIFEDKAGHLWFGTWQGISIYDGYKIMNAKDKEPWTN